MGSLVAWPPRDGVPSSCPVIAPPSPSYRLHNFSTRALFLPPERTPPPRSSDFDLEWKRLELRLDDRVTFRSPFDRLMRVRTWAAERLQTVYRTVVGMMKHRKALDLLLEAELPTLNPAERQALLNLKFRLVLAVQTCELRSGAACILHRGGGCGGRGCWKMHGHPNLHVQFG